jgi:hypothetical protein
MFAAVAIVLCRVTVDALAISTSYRAVTLRRKKSDERLGSTEVSIVLVAGETSQSMEEVKENV